MSGTVHLRTCNVADMREEGCNRYSMENDTRYICRLNLYFVVVIIKKTSISMTNLDREKEPSHNGDEDGIGYLLY